MGKIFPQQVSQSVSQRGGGRLRMEKEEESKFYFRDIYNCFHPLIFYSPYPIKTFISHHDSTFSGSGEKK